MTSSRPTLEHLLVVEDNHSLAATIEHVVTPFGESTHVATTVADAIDLIERFSPELLLLDVVLPDGSAFDILDAVDAMACRPQVLAISGNASAAQTFELARRGVPEFLAKPIDLTELRDSVAHLAQTTHLDTLLRQRVGMQALCEVEAHVRRVMVEEALERSGGSVRGAARLLGVSRQNLQYILRTQLA